MWMNRCGVGPGEPVVALAQAVASCRNLRFAGLQAYHGSAQHIRRHENRLAAINTAAEKVKLTLRLLRQAGLSAETVSGGGTGSFEFELQTGVWTELQCGSYVFMDADYLRNLRADGVPGGVFEPSLFILATVMSRPAPERAVVDAGLKALSVDSAAVGGGLRGRGVRGRLGRARQAGGARRLRRWSWATSSGSSRSLRPDREPVRLVRLLPRLAVWRPSGR
jgi:D-serine deaminase-like pyridoxal phosphate-dependent protein